MSQKTTQIKLSFADKEILAEALNLMHHGQKRRMNKLIRMGENLYRTVNSEKSKLDAIKEFVGAFVPDEPIWR